MGRMHDLGLGLRDQAAAQVLTLDVIKTSEIEGERLNADSVRSSVARRLGVDIGALAPADRNVDGVVDMVLDATGNYAQPLTTKRLFGWHAAPAGDPVLKAGLAHLWFVTLHPFDDGNGRIARAVGDMALARADQSATRFYSLSAQIQGERKAYYDQLERAQKGTLDATAWLEWFLGCLLRAVQAAENTLAAVITKARFWQHWAGIPLNARQHKVLTRLLDGFEGKLTSSKWAAITKCSSDTALRDITDLLDHGVLVKSPAAGRSTSYELSPIHP